MDEAELEETGEIGMGEEHTLFGRREHAARGCRV
jgi:hypothetical protein